MGQFKTSYPSLLHSTPLVINTSGHDNISNIDFYRPSELRQFYSFSGAQGGRLLQLLTTTLQVTLQSTTREITTGRAVTTSIPQSYHYRHITRLMHLMREGLSSATREHIELMAREER